MQDHILEVVAVMIDTPSDHDFYTNGDNAFPVGETSGELYNTHYLSGDLIYLSKNSSFSKRGII